MHGLGGKLWFCFFVFCSQNAIILHCMHSCYSVLFSSPSPSLVISYATVATVMCSGEGGAAAQRAEALLQEMYQLYQSGRYDSLRPTTGVFNAVIKAWANCSNREQIAPVRAEQILNWMQTLTKDLSNDVQPDKFTFNTTMHAYARSGNVEAAEKAQQLLSTMHKMYLDGNVLAKPDTIS